MATGLQPAGLTTLPNTSAIIGWQGRTRTDMQLLNREPAYPWRTRQIWCNGNDSNVYLPGFNRALYLL